MVVDGREQKVWLCNKQCSRPRQSVYLYLVIVVSRLLFFVGFTSLGCFIISERYIYRSLLHAHLLIKALHTFNTLGLLVPSSQLSGCKD